MARKGICGVCGRGGKLTDEHIPPECAGNFHDIALHSLKDWLDADGNADQMQNAQPRPKGTLWTTICEICNVTVLGSWYVPEFCKFVGGVVASLIIESQGDEANLKKLGPGAWVRISGTDLRPLCLVKTIAGMILALNAEGDLGFRERHSALAQFVLDQGAPLPDPYRAYLAIHIGDYATFTPTAFKFNREHGETIAFSCIEYPPLAYIITFNEQDPDTRPFLPCGGLSEFAKAPYGLTAKFSIDLLMGFRDTPLPGEYGQGAEAPQSGSENPDASTK